jgi:hypothetical protein
MEGFLVKDVVKNVSVPRTHLFHDLGLSDIIIA